MKKAKASIAAPLLLKKIGTYIFPYALPPCPLPHHFAGSHADTVAPDHLVAST
jgi:hypothetical protein